MSKETLESMEHPTCSPARSRKDMVNMLVRLGCFLAFGIFLCFMPSVVARVVGAIFIVITLVCIAFAFMLGHMFVTATLERGANAFLGPRAIIEALPWRKRKRREARADQEAAAKRASGPMAIDRLVGFHLRVPKPGVPSAFAADQPEEVRAILDANQLAEREACYAWLQGAPAREATIKASDGVVLAASVYEVAPASDRWVILVHGYAGCRTATHLYSRHWAEAGWNLVMVDLRAHGKSGGELIGMGYLDRRDLVSWADWVVGEHPGAKVVLHGHSMGASSICQAIAEPDLPANVVAAISEASYESGFEGVTNLLERFFDFPASPTIDFMNVDLRLRKGGYDLAEADNVRALANAKVPVLIIHGDRDSAVDCGAAKVLDAACSSEHELLMVAGAGHCEACLVDPDLYWDHVFGFVGRYV